MYYVYASKTAYCSACEKMTEFSVRPPKGTSCPHCGAKARIEGIKTEYSDMRRHRTQDHYFIRRCKDGIICLGVNVDFAEMYYHAKQRVITEKRVICYRAIINDGKTLRTYNMKSGKPVRTSFGFSTYTVHSSLWWSDNYCLIGWFDRAKILIRRHPNPMFRKMPEPKDLSDIIRYTQVAEMLYKNGFTRLLEDYLHGRASALRTTAHSREKLFGLTAAEIKIARKFNMDSQELSRLHEARKLSGYQVKEENILLAASPRLSGVFRGIKESIPDISFSRVVEAINRYGANDVSALYLDYIRAIVDDPAVRISPAVLYPQNLRKAHDEAIAKQTQRRIDRQEERFQKRVEELTKLCYQEEAYQMIAPRSSLDLKKEGTALSHCVGVYAERVASGSTAVMLLRKTEAPEVPFITVEYNEKEYRIVQARGIRNCETDEEVQQFLKRWVSRLKRRSEARERSMAGVCR